MSQEVLSQSQRQRQRAKQRSPIQPKISQEVLSRSQQVRVYLFILFFEGGGEVYWFIKNISKVAAKSQIAFELQTKHYNKHVKNIYLF